MDNTQLSLANTFPEVHVLATMNPAQQQAFTRLVKMSAREVKAQAVYVDASQFRVCSPGGRFHVAIDVAEMLGEGVSLAFELTRATPSDLGRLKGERDAMYIEDGHRVFVTEGTTQCTLHQPLDPTAPTPPALDEQHHTGVELQDICPKRLRAVLGKGAYTTLKIYDGQLEQACCNGGSSYTFQPESYFHLLGKKPELELLSTYLGTGCSGTSMSLQLAQDHGSYWLVTTCKLTINATLKSYELLVNP